MIAATLGVLLVGVGGGVLLEQSFSGRGAVVEPGVIDVGFAQDMVVHHLQAVTMVSSTRGHSNDPAIRQLAFDVESTQLEQVGQMQSWLAVWSRPSTSRGGYMAWMADPAGHGHSQASGSLIPLGGVTVMPGMATQQELAKLRSLSGHDLDVFFLQLVLRHHAGGAPMAQYVAEHANLGAVRALARSIVTSQTVEMVAITGMLTELGEHPLKYPHAVFGDVVVRGDADRSPQAGLPWQSGAPGARCGHQAAFARQPRSGDTPADHDGDVACILIKLRS